MKYPDRKVRSIEDLLKSLRRDNPTGKPIWFRGQGNEKWELKPSLARIENGLENEPMLIKRFKQHAFPFLNQRPMSEWEWQFIMQHHGVPTRLLDWTENPLVGLFFAAEHHPKQDGSLVCLLPVELNREANIELGLENDILSFDHEDVLKLYQPSALEAQQTTKNKPVAAIAARNTPRMQAQSGVFTICHRDLTPIDQIGQGTHVWRYVIPMGEKEKFLRELSRFNVNRLSLFPELTSVGEHLKGLF